jgi:hypothetical protein
MLLEPFRFSDWLSETRPENKIDRTQKRKLDDLTGEYLIFGGYPAGLRTINSLPYYSSFEK